MPNRSSDCPGVLDYILCPPHLLTKLPNHGLKVIDTTADFSDHMPVTIVMEVSAEAVDEPEVPQHFIPHSLKTLCNCDNSATLNAINKELEASLSWQQIIQSLTDLLTSSMPWHSEPQVQLDAVVFDFESLIFSACESHGLVRKRPTGNPGKKRAGEAAAPSFLRAL
eukprot:7424599-Karenia_brevis.AAC.1